MAEAGRHDATIERLAAALRPVGRLPAPWKQAALWLGVAVALGAALAAFSDLSGIARRLSAEPDMWLAALGSTATAALAAWAAFATAVPGAGRFWPVLPIPSLLLWMGASGWGCLRADLVPGTTVAAIGETKDCLMFILGLSVPLTATMFLMVRRGFALHPATTASLAGLAAAAAAATLLNFIHPFDAALTDLVVHGAAVVVVVGVARSFGSQAAKRSAW